MGAVKSHYRKKIEKQRLNHEEFDLYCWRKENETKAKRIKEHLSKKGISKCKKNT